MSDFLLVLGEDKEYPGRKASCFIAKATIREIHPIWAVESDGKLWACSRGFKDEKSGNRAKVHAFRLITLSSQEFTCSVERMRTYLNEDEYTIVTGENSEVIDRRIGFHEGPTDSNGRAYLEAIARDRREDLENTLQELDKGCSNSSSTPII